MALVGSTNQVVDPTFCLSCFEIDTAIILRNLLDLNPKLCYIVSVLVML